MENKMKNNISIKNSLILFVIFTFITATIISAQPDRTPPKIPSAAEITNMVDDLSEKLSLSEKQHKEIKDLFTEHFSELKEKMEAKRSEHNAERKKMGNHREEFEKEVKDLLTEDQAVQFDDFMKHKREQREKHPRSRKQ